jgi:hypothetical protein
LKLASVMLARTIAYMEVANLNISGKIFIPDLVKELAEYCRFQKFPQTVEEYNIRSKDGMVFQQGILGDRPIQKFVIGVELLYVETREDTDASKAILQEILLWCSDKLGATYEPGMIKRFGYVNCVSFYSDVPILKASRAIERLATDTTKAVSEIVNEPVIYHPINIEVGHDPTARKFGIAKFQITRRADIRFADNTYYSEAPLSTDLHLRMLEQFERDVAIEGKAPYV